MKNENILLIGGGLAALWLASSKRAAIGNIYPLIENEMQSSVINGYLPSAQTLKEANFFIKSRPLEKHNLPSITSTSAAIDLFSKLADIDTNIRMPKQGIKIVVLFLNKRNEPIDHVVYNHYPTTQQVFSKALSIVAPGFVIYALSPIDYPRVFQDDDSRLLNGKLKAMAPNFGVAYLDWVAFNGNSTSSAVDVGLLGINGLEYRLRRGPNMPKPRYYNPEIRDFLRKVIGQKMLLQEVGVVIYYDAKQNPIAYTLHSLGSNDATMLDAKIIYGAAAKIDAKGIVISHNHPSGTNKPSQADLNVTEKIKYIGQQLDIPLLDHIIVTNSEKYYSFSENGLL